MAPAPCFVEVFVSVEVRSDATVAVGIEIYKNSVGVPGTILWCAPGAVNNSSSGMGVISCLTGDAISLRTVLACTILAGHGYFQVL